MLFYLHGGDLPSWVIWLLILLVIFVPSAIVVSPFLFLHFYLRKKEKQAKDDKNP